MDQTVAKFVARTGADDGLARDLLAGKNWNFFGALEAYESLCKLKDSDDSNLMIDEEIQMTNLPNSVSAPSHFKNDEHADNTRLTRGISRATGNIEIVSNVRHQFSRGIASPQPDATDQSIRQSDEKNVALERKVSVDNNNHHHCHIETLTYTFTLPNFNMFNEEFRIFLEKDLIETASLKALETSGHLNWWAAGGTCQKLWPLATTGDGNCLLHAASLGMWGFHDRLLLRKALHLLLTKGSRRHALWRRWRWQQSHSNKETGLIYSEEEWRAEWENIVRLASPQPRTKPNSAEGLSSVNQSIAFSTQAKDSNDDTSDTVYESLEELHVFALAHVLKRPIIVIADTVLRDAGGEAFAPIPFGGIYLPLECSPAECHRSPLVLCYDAAHFSALVIMQDQDNCENVPLAIVPITDKERRLLPLHFASDPGPDFTWWTDEEDTKISAAATLSDKRKIELIARYMRLRKVPAKKVKGVAMNGAFLGGKMCKQEHFGSHDGFSCDKKCQCLTPESGRKWSGSTGHLEKTSRMLSVAPARIVWSKFTRTIKRRLKSKTRTLSRLNGRHREEMCKTCCASSNNRACQCKVLCARTIGDVGDVNFVVGAQLCTDSHHQFMKEMVENYLKAARTRYETEKDNKSQHRPMRRERLSRSFSASSVFVRCINGDCVGQASHQTNFLCDSCFRTQKQLMESFTVAGNQNGRTPVVQANGGGGGDSKSSRAASVPCAKPTSTRPTFQAWSNNSNSTPVSATTRSRLYDIRPSDLEPAPAVTVVLPMATDSKPASSSGFRSAYRSIETRYGVSAVTNPHGVTHYFMPTSKASATLPTTKTSTAECVNERLLTTEAARL